MRALTLMVATGLLVACNQQSTEQDNPENQLRAANAQYDQALVQGDAAVLNRYYTDDFQRIGNDGAVHDKKDQVQFMTKEVDLLNGRGDDVKVTMLGPDGALVTGRFAGRYRYKGTEDDFTERYTSVWVRQDSQWRVRHEHASLLPKSQKQSSADRALIQRAMVSAPKRRVRKGWKAEFGRTSSDLANES